MAGISALFESYKDAVYRKDAEGLLSLFDEDVRVFDMWAWRYDGLPAWRDMVTGWFSSLGTTRDVVTFDDIRIHESGEMGIASAFVRFAATDESGNELRFLQNRLTWAVRKKAGAWKIIHEHTSGPVDGETLKVRLQR